MMHFSPEILQTIAKFGLYSSHIFAMVTVKFITFLNAPNIIYFTLFVSPIVLYILTVTIYYKSIIRETRTKVVTWNKAICTSYFIFEYVISVF